MLSVGFEPAILVSERLQTHALDRVATIIIIIIIIMSPSVGGPSHPQQWNVF